MYLLHELHLQEIVTNFMFGIIINIQTACHKIPFVVHYAAIAAFHTDHYVSQYHQSMTMVLQDNLKSYSVTTIGLKCDPARVSD